MKFNFKIPRRKCSEIPSSRETRRMVINISNQLLLLLFAILTNCFACAKIIT